MPPAFDRGLIARLCTEATCAGQFSRIMVYRTPSGQQLLVRAERRVSSEREAQQSASERAAVLDGLVPGEAVSCYDIPRD